MIVVKWNMIVLLIKLLEHLKFNIAEVQLVAVVVKMSPYVNDFKTNKKSFTMKTQIAKTRTLLLFAALLISATPTYADLYPSSVVGTDFDYILETDPDTFICLEFKGQGWREMPDKTSESPLKQKAFIFVSYFNDGTSIDMAIDADFETEDKARKEALRYTPRLGKLPTSLRSGVKRVVVHKGDATAFSDVGLMILYSENATKRISTHDLEETVFHESVHASWDGPHANSPDWLTARKSDGLFVTTYAKKNGEDLAESALFAYTLLHHPERIPSVDSAKIKSAIPARIAFVKELLPLDKSIHYAVGPKYECDGSGTTFTVDAPDEVEDNGGQENECNVTISTVGELSDILSNALRLGLGEKESTVRSLLKKSNKHVTNKDIQNILLQRH